jgi:hypothetical protein
VDRGAACSSRRGAGTAGRAGDDGLVAEAVGDADRDDPDRKSDCADPAGDPDGADPDEYPDPPDPAGDVGPAAAAGEPRRPDLVRPDPTSPEPA